MPRATELLRSVRVRRVAPWVAYAATSLACTLYLNTRAGLVPEWGKWYPGDPIMLMQSRALLAGHTYMEPHPLGATSDMNWGRNGMHQAWGLGVPLLEAPFHAVARLFGVAGFPDQLLFLIFYAAVAIVLARALHALSDYRAEALGASCGAAGFVMVFPTFVGLVASRFRVYEQTIGLGALWNVAVLGGLIALSARYTRGRLLALSAMAGFALVIRPPLGIYGVTTVGLALLVAKRSGASRRELLEGAVGFGATSSIYCIGNVLRFGSPFNAGYANSLSNEFINRLTRWGLPFARVPLTTAAKEMFATWFLLDPVSSQTNDTPPAVRPFAVGVRWREFYAPTYNLFVLAILLAAVAIALSQVRAHRLWERDRPLKGEVIALLGAWALVPFVVLFFFYARIPQSVTRYATDVYPAIAAAFLCVGMALVAAVRSAAPELVASTQLAIAGLMALYLAGARGWVTHLSEPVDRKAMEAAVARHDTAGLRMQAAPDHFRCKDPRGTAPIWSHLDGWKPDCGFESGMVFAKAYSPCISLTFAPGGASWSDADQRALAALRVNADYDPLVACGPAAVQGEERHLTMCEPRPPGFLLDDMRLYAIASLDENLEPIDRLKLLRIESAKACP